MPFILPDKQPSDTIAVLSQGEAPSQVEDEQDFTLDCSSKCTFLLYRKRNEVPDPFNTDIPSTLPDNNVPHNPSQGEVPSQVGGEQYGSSKDLTLLNDPVQDSRLAGCTHA